MKVSYDQIRMKTNEYFGYNTLVAGRSCKACGTKSVLPQESILKARSTLNFLAHSISSNCLLGHINSSYLIKIRYELFFYLSLKKKTYLILAKRAWTAIHLSVGVLRHIHATKSRTWTFVLAESKIKLRRCVYTMECIRFKFHSEYSFLYISCVWTLSQMVWEIKWMMTLIRCCVIDIL